MGVPWPPRMVTVEADELPDALRRFATAATAVGWSVWSTYSEASVEDKAADSIAVRLGHGEHRCYGVWKIGETPKGKISAKWAGGASRHGHHFPTLAALQSYAGIA